MTRISSGLRLLFLVHFVVALVFGLLYLLFPKIFLGMVGMPVSDLQANRVIGAAILTFATSSWFCYKNPEWERVKIVVIAEIVWTVLVVLLGLYGIFFAGTPATEWIDVVMMAGFAAAFIWFYFKK